MTRQPESVQVQINTVFPSLAPEEVERQITFPVELCLSGLPGLRLSAHGEAWARNCGAVQGGTSALSVFPRLTAPTT
ncbi:MAG TPA: hypothetical protein VH575_32240 [Gemmataceae bacterium]